VLACDAGETNTSIAKRMGLTGMTVGKWRKRYRELGLEGLTVDKVRDIAGRLYLNPPDKAMVLCVDDKCQPPVKKPPEMRRFASLIVTSNWCRDRIARFLCLELLSG
jgi:hypothetical protein